MIVVMLLAAITKNSPITTWLATFGLSRFQSPTKGQLDPKYISPSPRKPNMAAIGAMSCAMSLASVNNLVMASFSVKGHYLCSKKDEFVRSRAVVG